MPVELNKNIFFAKENPSITPFYHSSLNSYLSELPDFPDFIHQLFAKKLSNLAECTPLNIKTFLNESQFCLSSLNIPPEKLVASALYEHSHWQELIVPTLNNYPQEYSTLNKKIDCYLALLIDVLNNDLAQKLYEQEIDREKCN